MAAPQVVVIGAGVAGLAAAVQLAGAGVRVQVIDRAPRPGGRTTAFVDPTTGDRVDNGPHALFGCYRETYAFLRTIGSDHLAPLDPTLSLVMADRLGRQFELACPPWPSPWHLLAGIATWQALPFRDRWSALRLGDFLREVHAEGADAAAARVPEAWTVSQWLASQGQGAAICEWLWTPLALAALNQSPEVASARVFARVVGELLGRDSASAAVGVPRVPLDELLVAPAVRYIEARGGEVVTKMRSEAIFQENRLRSQAIAAVISAVPWHAFADLWGGLPDVPAEVRAIAEAARLVESEPIVSVHLWLDRPVLTHRQVGLVGTDFQWVFGGAEEMRSEAISASGRGNGLRSHFRVALVASAARHLLRRDNRDLAALAERELREGVPAARDARVAHARVVREAGATFSVAPGAPARPGTRTALPWLFLAGDWTDTGLPATIEGAVRSGHAAAEAVLASAAIAGRL